MPLPALVERFGAKLSAMDPYAGPDERKIGAHRPRIAHLPSAIESRTRNERHAEKSEVAAERRAIKKSARRHLQKELLADLENCGEISQP